MKKIALISMLALLACGSVFAKGKKDKSEVEETVVEKKLKRQKFLQNLMMIHLQNKNATEKKDVHIGHPFFILQIILHKQ